MLTNIAIIVLAALLGNLIFSKLGLPGILGMIAAGVILGPSGLLIDPEVLGLLKEFGLSPETNFRFFDDRALRRLKKIRELRTQGRSITRDRRSWKYCRKNGSLNRSPNGSR